MKPFLKWAGGKSRLVPALKKHFPADGKRFIEPFLGAGSVLLNVDYPICAGSDVNLDLILTWQELSLKKGDFIARCEKLFCEANNNEEAYNRLREEFNNVKEMVYESDRASELFVYLNRHCFNGLCRYNSKGKFNVPFGGYKSPYFPRKEMEACIEKVSTFSLHSWDFRQMFEFYGQKGDVFYCDPPYLPLTSTASFNTYSEGGFGLKDHIDLAQCAALAARRGATVVISNHYNWYTLDLYKKWFGAKIYTLDVKRTISSKVTERNRVKEIIAVFQG